MEQKQGKILIVDDNEDLLKAEIRELKDEGWRVKEIAEVLGEKFGYPKKEIYRLSLAGAKVNR